MYHILVVEDDKALSDGIRLALQDGEHEVFQAESLAQAEGEIFGMNAGGIDLVILDLNLPDGNGLTLLQKIRKAMDLPVIILTANDLEVDIVTGLESGADDYITKPFSLMVLRARVNTQLRKIKKGERARLGDAGELILGPFCFAFSSMEYTKNGQPLFLSRTEQKLLKILVENRGNTVPKERILDAIWTEGGEFVDDNALPVAVKRLREKLEDDSSSPEYIKNVYGVGYTWVVK